MKTFKKFHIRPCTNLYYKLSSQTTFSDDDILHLWHTAHKLRIRRGQTYRTIREKFLPRGSTEHRLRDRTRKNQSQHAINVRFTIVYRLLSLNCRSPTISNRNMIVNLKKIFIEILHSKNIDLRGTVQ